jgi:hypothetical protein
MARFLASSALALASVNCLSAAGWAVAVDAAGAGAGVAAGVEPQETKNNENAVNSASMVRTLFFIQMLLLEGVYIGSLVFSIVFSTFKTHISPETPFSLLPILRQFGIL